jgi:hypothetical protein
VGVKGQRVRGSGEIGKAKARMAKVQSSTHQGAMEYQMERPGLTHPLEIGASVECAEWNL